MQIACHIALVLEMVYVNLYTASLCSKKRYSSLVTWSVLHGFTAVLVTGMIILLTRLPGYGNGNGLFVLAGAVYLLPLYFLLDQPVHYTISVACSAWIYTLFAFTLCLRLGYLFFPYTDPWFAPTVLALQTVFYGATLPVFFRFIRNRFLYILRHLDGKNARALLRLSILWFLYSVLTNYIMVVEQASLLKLAAVLLLGCNAVMSYNLFYSLITSHLDAAALREDVQTDALTKLKNRTCLDQDVQSLIDKGDGFDLYFLDLNQFKSINDRYGHLLGDQYLIRFAEAFQRQAADLGTLYRVSGDEFIFLCTSGQDVSRQLQTLRIPACREDVAYLGHSLGKASYPSDGDTLDALIAAADSHMYSDKRGEKSTN